ncbi:MAG TPA: TIGR00282 family metallophosphoesterase [Bryobacteraceae bacterium]|nr:TIGR00282 family metallophosphoesterase [Bryobacteraceae bacterium]
MNILFIGDIFASPGRGIVAEKLHAIVCNEQIDLVIANAENAAGGFGITPLIADELLKLGIAVLTSGNHIWDKKEIYEYLPRQPRLLRPANYADELPGRGWIVVSSTTGVQCAVINLQGRAHMPATECPFRKADRILDEIPAPVKVRFVDFHAELTSEKIAMGWYLDGRVSAIVGTHTHVPTADARVLQGGSAYLTDCGMTGPYNSVIGVDKDIILRRFLTALPVRMEAARGGVELHAVIVDVDESTGRARAIRPYVEYEGR